MVTEIVIAGSGGQGIQFLGQVLGIAAMRQGLQATYVPNYGAERRGGPSFCSVVVADEFIYAPVFTRPDVLLALDQRGRNEYGAGVKPGGLILANSDLAPSPAEGETARAVAIPASALAERICREGALNLVMLSAWVGLTGRLDPALVEAVTRERSARKPELLATNLEALSLGAAWAKENRP
jgi:2-oxoglutarate ferredoxin oxidoreductase subunit gamma